MDGLQRATFRFGNEIEVRYLRDAPETGDFVAHTNGLWIVTFVSADAAGITVVCELRDGEGLRPLERG
jgi:hypothetical protein